MDSLHNEAGWRMLSALIETRWDGIIKGIMVSNILKRLKRKCSVEA